MVKSAGRGPAKSAGIAARRPLHRVLRVGLAGLVVAAIAGAAVWVLTDPNLDKPASASRPARAVGTVSGQAPGAASGSGIRSDPRVPLYSANFIDDSGNSSAFRYSAPIADRRLLPQCYASAVGRVRRG